MVTVLGSLLAMLAGLLRHLDPVTQLAATKPSQQSGQPGRMAQPPEKKLLPLSEPLALTHPLHKLLTAGEVS